MIKDKTSQFESEIQSLNHRLEEKSKASKNIRGTFNMSLLLSRSCTAF